MMLLKAEEMLVGPVVKRTEMNPINGVSVCACRRLLNKFSFHRTSYAVVGKEQQQY